MLRERDIDLQVLPFAVGLVAGVSGVQALRGMELDLEIRPRGRAPRHVQAGIGRIGGGEAIVDPRDAQALLLQPLPRVREPDPEPVRRQQHDPAHRIASRTRARALACSSDRPSRT